MCVSKAVNEQKDRRLIEYDSDRVCDAMTATTWKGGGDAFTEKTVAVFVPPIVLLCKCANMQIETIIILSTILTNFPAIIL